MSDEKFRFNVFGSDRETNQYIGYQLKRIADTLENQMQGTMMFRCTFCECNDKDAIQFQKILGVAAPQPVCEYCYDKFQEACMEAALEQQHDDA